MLGLVEHQAQVFAHPVHGKAKLKLVGHHGLAAVVELPALRRALADHVQRQVHVQAGFLAEGNRLAQALHQPGDADLVDHLGQLAGATVAHECEGLGKRHTDALHRIKSGGVTTAHDGERAVLRAALATRHRRINEMQTQRLGCGVQLARHRGRGRGVVHQHRARLHAGQRAVSAQHHAAQVVVIANAAKHNVGIGCSQPRRGRLARRCGGSELSAPGRCLGRAAVVNGDLMPGQRQMAGHGVAHHTQAQKGDFAGSDGGVGFGVGAAHGVISVVGVGAAAGAGKVCRG